LLVLRGAIDRSELGKTARGEQSWTEWVAWAERVREHSGEAFGKVEWGWFSGT
jgi:hypothetical protein